MPSLRHLPLLALLLTACSESLPPAQDPPQATAVAVASTRPEPPAPPPSASAAPVASAAPAASADPAAPEPPADDDNGPKIDCAKLPAGASPGRRSLCEMAMAMAPEALLDERGFALVTQFEQPGEDADPREGKQRKRVCGDEARQRAKRLYRTIRYTLSQGDEQDPWVTCQGLTCELRGQGEWSTSSTLYFRQTKGKLALEAWTEIERVLVSEQEVKRREKLLAQGLQALRGTTCKPR